MIHEKYSSYHREITNIICSFSFHWFTYLFFSYFFNRKLTLNNISLTAVEFSESVINGLILFFFSLFFMFLTPSDLLNHINNKTTFLDCQFFEIIMTFGSCLVDTVWFDFFNSALTAFGSLLSLSKKNHGTMVVGLSSIMGDWWWRKPPVLPFHTRILIGRDPTQYYEASDYFLDSLTVMNSIFTMLFLFECLLKIAAFGVKVPVFAITPNNQSPKTTGNHSNLFACGKKCFADGIGVFFHFLSLDLNYFQLRKKRNIWLFGRVLPNTILFFRLVAKETRHKRTSFPFISDQCLIFSLLSNYPTSIWIFPEPNLSFFLFHRFYSQQIPSIGLWYVNNRIIHSSPALTTATR